MANNQSDSGGWSIARLLFGAGITALTFGGLWCYLAAKANSQTTSVGQLLMSEKLADVGQLISGVAGAVAFIWIVLAYFQQSEELALQRRELRLQREEFQRLANETEAQGLVLKQTGLAAKRDTFMRLLEVYERQLVTQASEIGRLTSEGVSGRDNHAHAWAAYEQGDRDAHFRYVIGMVIRGNHDLFKQRVEKLMGGMALLERFSTTAGIIVSEAQSVDQKMADLCKMTAWAFLAETFDRLRMAPPAQ
jgi:hypothetical protein